MQKIVLVATCAARALQARYGLKRRPEIQVGKRVRGSARDMRRKLTRNLFERRYLSPALRVLVLNLAAAVASLRKMCVKADSPRWDSRRCSKRDFTTSHAVPRS